MAFVCEHCLLRKYEPIYYRLSSYGPCEDCRKTRDCADIPSMALTLKKKIEPKQEKLKEYY